MKMKLLALFEIILILNILVIPKDVVAVMTESPFKMELSHDFVKSLVLSNGGSILSVLEDLKLESTSHSGSDGKTLNFKEIVLSTVPVSGPSNLEMEFNKE